MAGRGELQYWLVVEKRDGSRAVLSVYKHGGSLVIVEGDGEPTRVGRDRKLESELRIVYGATLLETVMPSEGFPTVDVQ